MLHYPAKTWPGYCTLPLFLHPVFALYHLPGKGDTPRYIGLDGSNFYVRYQTLDLKIPLVEIGKVILEKRRKLAPLVVGGLVTSLSMLSILLYSSSLEVVGLAAAGLLLTYYGMQEYGVIHLEHANNTTLIWLPVKVSLAGIRPIIAMLEYYLNKQHFPVLFASATNNNRLVHDESQPVPSSGAVFYRFRNLQNPDIQQIAIDPTLLDTAIDIDANEDVIGTSNYLVNRSALLTGNTRSFA